MTKPEPISKEFNKFGVPIQSDSMGILKPAFQYRFRVRIDPKNPLDFWSEDTKIYVMQNIIHCETDYRNKVLVFSVRQPSVGPMQTIAEMICREGIQMIVLESLDNEIISYKLKFSNLTTLSHNSSYDYRESEVVFHEFKMNYETLEIEDELKI